MTILNRNEVDKSLTWDTSAIFKSKEDAKKRGGYCFRSIIKIKREL